jgi:hypothetical protein
MWQAATASTALLESLSIFPAVTRQLTALTVLLGSLSMWPAAMRHLTASPVTLENIAACHSDSAMSRASGKHSKMALQRATQSAGQRGSGIGEPQA